jgi:hypothetical protein
LLCSQLLQPAFDYHHASGRQLTGCQLPCSVAYPDAYYYQLNGTVTRWLLLLLLRSCIVLRIGLATTVDAAVAIAANGPSQLHDARERRTESIPAAVVPYLLRIIYIRYLHRYLHTNSTH